MLWRRRCRLVVGVNLIRRRCGVLNIRFIMLVRLVLLVGVLRFGISTFLLLFRVRVRRRLGRCGLWLRCLVILTCR